jgi:transcriptional regulator with XRE-family HTH domain
VRSVQQRLGAQLRHWRLKRGWSQEELAARAGRHWTYVGGVERGERNPTIQVISALAKALGISIRDLFPED